MCLGKTEGGYDSTEGDYGLTDAKVGLLESVFYYREAPLYVLYKGACLCSEG